MAEQIATSPITSLSTISSSEFGEAQACHLLRRTAFAPTPQMVRQLVELGPEAAVDLLFTGEPKQPDLHIDHLSLDPDIRRPRTAQKREMLREARREKDTEVLEKFRETRQMERRQDRQQMVKLTKWWLHGMTQTSHPFRESMTLFWHGHFATRYREVQDAYLMAQQNQLFRDHALNNFAELATGIVHDPAMLKFLNNDRNRRQNPNENLARELMELFTLGEGQYSEQDIRQGARALTGYHVYDNDFRFNERAHDTNTKTLLGREGDFDGDGFVRILLKQPSCPQFIAFKLYRHFVADIPEEPANAPPWAREVIQQLARTLARERYALKPMLKQLLTSRHFYAPQIVGQKIKSPIHLLVGSMRMLNVPQRKSKPLHRGLRLAGQVPFDPPSVAGWDGGEAWINTSTLFARQNLCAYLVRGNPEEKAPPAKVDPWRKYLANRSNSEAVDALLDLMVGHHLPPPRREPIHTFVKETKGLSNDKALRDTLLLITAMPEYQLC